MAFQELAEGHQAAVLAIVEYVGEPWLKGEKWTNYLNSFPITPRDFARLSRGALRVLTAAARKRRLL